MAAINPFNPLATEFNKQTKRSWNPRLPEKTKSAKSSGVQVILDNLYSNARWTKDTTIGTPKVLPAETPMVSYRTNTHRGKHFMVIDGTPEMRDGCLWLGAKLPLEKNEVVARTASYTAAEALVSKMRTQLEKVRARRVNATIMMKKPTGSEVCLYCVVAFE